jgi:hypothetical protein
MLLHNLEGAGSRGLRNGRVQPFSLLDTIFFRKEEPLDRTSATRLKELHEPGLCPDWRNAYCAALVGALARAGTTFPGEGATACPSVARASVGCCTIPVMAGIREDSPYQRACSRRARVSAFAPLMSLAALIEC